MATPSCDHFQSHYHITHERKERHVSLSIDNRDRTGTLVWRTDLDSLQVPHKLLVAEAGLPKRHVDIASLVSTVLNLATLEVLNGLRLLPHMPIRTARVNCNFSTVYDSLI